MYQEPPAARLRVGVGAAAFISLFLTVGRAWAQPRPGGGAEFFITFGKTLSE